MTQTSYNPGSEAEFQDFLVNSKLRVHGPTLSLLPATSSTQPVTLEPGQTLDVVVQVDNRDDRADRFYLICSDLPESWFTVCYPDALNKPSLVMMAGGLALNPGMQGQIVLLIHPPLDAPAGSYAPTIRLQSASHPDLVLLNRVYFQILPTYQVLMELRPLHDRIKQEPGQFELKLRNEGNTDREQQLPLPTDRVQSSALWQPRPWWQLLLLTLTSFGSLAAIAFLFGWAFLRPPEQPKVLNFSTNASTYQVGGDAKTSLASIQAAPVRIASFRIDGKDIKVNSKYLVPLNPKQPIKQLVLSWQVEGGPDLKVKLLPTPGAVRPTGSLPYLLTQKPGSKTLTLVVSNGAGVQISRVLKIETYPLSMATNTPKRSGLPSLPINPAATIPPLPIVTVPSTMPRTFVPPPPALGERISSPPRPIPNAPAGSLSGNSGPAAPASPAISPSPNPKAVAPSDPNTLSPSELPPQFDSR